MIPVALIRDIMTTEVKSVRPETSILEAATVLTKNQFNGVPVVDAAGKLVGLVTEYNILTRLLTYSAATKNEPKAKGILELPVSAVMEKEPITVYFDDTFESALALLVQHHRINPIPVIDRNHTLVGIASRSDFLKLLKLYGHT